jgi:hypothetical protein
MEHFIGKLPSISTTIKSFQNLKIDFFYSSLPKNAKSHFGCLGPLGVKRVCFSGVVMEHFGKLCATWSCCLAYLQSNAQKSSYPHKNAPHYTQFKALIASTWPQVLMALTPCTKQPLKNKHP